MENDIKNRVKKALRELEISPYSIARVQNLNERTIYDQINGNSKIGVATIEALLAYCPDLSAEWLLRGTAPMLKEQPNNAAEQVAEPKDWQKATANGLPLIPIEAVAGFNGIDVQGVRLEDCSRYIVPEFAELHAEFMIRVSGSSMYPKYSNGDILACRRVREVTFLQWGKVYVLDSNQGAMVKRLYPCQDNADEVECRSDNPNYLPFRLPKSDIRSVSIVVGVIRFE